MTKLLEPIYPGEILREEFMKPMGVSINKLARDIDVPPGRIREIVNGKRGITAEHGKGNRSPSTASESGIVVVRRGSPRA